MAQFCTNRCHTPISAALLDETGNITAEPQGILAITGEQLMLGYIQRPALMLDRMRTIDGQLYYVTGDIVARDSSRIFQPSF